MTISVLSIIILILGYPVFVNINEFIKLFVLFQTYQPDECISTRSVITKSRIHCVKANTDYGSSLACVRAINKVHKIVCDALIESEGKDNFHDFQNKRRCRSY